MVRSSVVVGKVLIFVGGGEFAFCEYRLFAFSEGIPFCVVLKRNSGDGSKKDMWKQTETLFPTCSPLVEISVWKRMFESLEWCAKNAQ